MIENEEFRGLFKVEAAEHIEKLEQGLMRLEQNPGDRTAIDELFRAAHSLKGAARMLHQEKVEVVAHRFEEVLGSARRGSTRLAPEAADRFYRALDSLREFTHESVTGEPATAQLEVVLASLDAPTAGEPPSATLLHSSPTSEPGPASGPGFVRTNASAAQSATPPPGASAASTAEKPATPAYRIETMRVESHKLDALMSQAGELSVTRGRLGHRVVAVEQLLGVWEEWVAASHTARSRLRDRSVTGSMDRLDDVLAHLQSEHERLDRMGSLLKELDAATKADATRVDQLAVRIEEGIRSIRMLPFSTLFAQFPRMVRDLARSQGKEIEFVAKGGETAADKRIMEELKDPLTHMLRNAIDHGIETAEERVLAGKPPRATISLHAFAKGSKIVLEIHDEGRGIDLREVRRAALQRGLRTEQELGEMSESQSYLLLFEPGFSTRSVVTEVSGRGVGLDVVRANVERLRGSIEVESTPSTGTTFRIEVPMTLATRRVLIAIVGNCKYAIPVESVLTTRLVSAGDIFFMGGRGTMVLAGTPISVTRLGDLLEIRGPAQSSHGSMVTGEPAKVPCVILQVDRECFGLLVDRLTDEQEVVLKGHGAILKRVRNVLGSTILQSGEICVVLNPHDLLKSMHWNLRPAKSVTTEAAAARKKVVLLAEDSIVTRTQEKRILEGAGFEVVSAVDGQDALNKLGTRSFDAIVCDVEMPNLDGLNLTARVRQNPMYKGIPIVLVTSLASDEDRRRGMEVGADAYIAKPDFDQTQFVDTLRRLA